MGAALLGMLALSIASSVSSGGGRELLSRSEAAIHPVSARTEHLGALALAPLNLAWFIQLWGLLAVVALVTPPGRLPGPRWWWWPGSSQPRPWDRRSAGPWRAYAGRPHGVLTVRAGGALVASSSPRCTSPDADPVVEALPTTRLAEAMQGDRWYVAALVLLLGTVLLVGLGARPAAWALGLPPREELRVQSGVHEARHAPQPRWGSPTGRCCAASTATRSGARSACGAA